MDFEFSPDAQAMQDTLKKSMQRHFLPANREWHHQAENGTYPLDVIEPGTRMSNLDYAPMAEIMGRPMRFIDGPDEVHLRVLARNELGKAKANRGATLPYYLVLEENT